MPKRYLRPINNLRKPRLLNDLIEFQLILGEGFELINVIWTQQLHQERRAGHREVHGLGGRSVQA